MKVVCFSEIQWRYVRTRKQQILKRFPGHWEVLFLSSVVAGKENNFRPQRDGRIVHVCIPVFKNFPQKILRFLSSLPPARFIWNIILWVWVRIIMKKTGFDGGDKVFYVSNIYYASVLRHLSRRFMLYDCNDDPLEFPNVMDWAGKYFRMLALDADQVTAVSVELSRKLDRMGAKEVRVIGNGVDYELFEESASREAPPQMRKLRKPVLGYAGAIAQWFDIGLLDRLAAEFPHGSLALLGPLFESRRKQLEKIIEERGNVYYLGSKPYEDLGAYLAAMDVCLIPLKINLLMKFADPNKIYEYAAAGKPVVTMKFSEEMEKLSEIVYLSKDQDEFVDNVRTALAGGADVEKLRKFARENSWQSRSDEMAELLRRGCQGGRG